MTLDGKLSGEVVISGLVSGLSHRPAHRLHGDADAFRSIEPLYGSHPSELQLRSVALDGAGAAVWEWNARRDEIKVGPIVETMIGLNPGDLPARVEEFARYLHPADLERFKIALWSVQERSDGRIRGDFRLRQADNTYRWFELEAAALPGSDPRALRCVGLMRDVSDSKRAHERLLHDAVRDSLTGLPNRALFLDRLQVAIARAKSEPHVRPSLVTINIDKFKTINASVGLVLGDSLLLTVARRLQRHLSPSDTLARIGGDEFAVLSLSSQSDADVAANAERIRRSLRSPIKIVGRRLC